MDNNEYDKWDIDELKKLLEKNNRNLINLKLKATDYGHIDVPLPIINSIAETERALAKIYESIDKRSRITPEPDKSNNTPLRKGDIVVESETVTNAPDSVLSKRDKLESVNSDPLIIINPIPAPSRTETTKSLSVSACGIKLFAITLTTATSALLLLFFLIKSPGDAVTAEESIDITTDLAYGCLDNAQLNKSVLFVSCSGQFIKFDTVSKSVLNFYNNPEMGLAILDPSGNFVAFSTKNKILISSSEAITPDLDYKSAVDTGIMGSKFVWKPDGSELIIFAKSDIRAVNPKDSSERIIITYKKMLNQSIVFPFIDISDHFISPDGKYLYFSYRDKNILTKLEIQTGNTNSKIFDSSYTHIELKDVSPNGKYLLLETSCSFQSNDTGCRMHTDNRFDGLIVTDSDLEIVFGVPKDNYHSSTGENNFFTDDNRLVILSSDFHLLVYDVDGSVDEKKDIDSIKTCRQPQASKNATFFICNAHGGGGSIIDLSGKQIYAYGNGARSSKAVFIDEKSVIASDEHSLKIIEIKPQK